MSPDFPKKTGGATASEVWGYTTREITHITGTPRSDILGEDATLEAGTGARKAKIDALLGSATEIEGTLTATGLEQDLVSTTDNKLHVIDGHIDLTPLQAGDTVVVKQYFKVKSGGQFIEYAEETYNDVQTQPDLHISTNYGKYGIRITLTQTGGTNRSYDYMFAKLVKT